MTEIAALIIDDSEEDRYLLSRQLRETELVHTIFEKNDGKEALEFFLQHEQSRAQHPESFPPLLVFLDINMPFVNGYEFLERFAPIRKEIEAESSVFLMFTSSEQATEKEKAMGYEFVKDYLVKGKFSSQELKEKIQQLVRIIDPNQ